MKILSIETSCDETAIALLDISGAAEKPEINVLGNTLHSQAALHEQYGGVYPMMAKREHEKNLPILLEETLKQAPLSLPRRGLGEVDIDCIAVTAGPGLEPALWAGITFAEELGKKWGKPVIPVNHMEGHIWSVLYQEPPISKGLELPALALLVSGGHTELVHIKNFGDYEVIGRTKDDAAGEAFDKVARMLGLSYPGGPKLSALAEEARSKKLEAGFKFPRPMINSGDFNFSFSGLKTAVLYKLRDNKDLSKELVAKEFEDAAVEVLVVKTSRALESFGDEIKTLIVAGGVAANTILSLELKKMMESFPEVSLRLPVRALTTDNAVMIGIAAFEKIIENTDVLENKTPLKARGNLNFAAAR